MVFVEQKSVRYTNLYPFRLREENEYLMNQHLTKVRTLEQEKSDLITQNIRKLEEIEREKMEDLNKVKDIHR